MHKNAGSAVGNKYGRLTVKTKSPTRLGFYICECECENKIEVSVTDLKITKSCGCLRNEESTATLKNATENDCVLGTRLSMLMHKRPAKTNTGIVGVSKLKNGKYRARIKVQGKDIRLIDTYDLEEAIKVREEAVKKYHAPLVDKIKDLKSEIEDKANKSPITRESLELKLKALFPNRNDIDSLINEINNCIPPAVLNKYGYNKLERVFNFANKYKDIIGDR